MRNLAIQMSKILFTDTQWRN